MTKKEPRKATSPSFTPNFESCGGKLYELDDGHVPETFSDKGKWIHYPEMDLEAQVLVYDNVLPTCTVNELYQKTISEGQPWGSYVTMDQVKEYWESSSPTNEEQQQSPIVVAVGFFLKTTMGGSAATARIPSPPTELVEEATTTLLSLENVHGVAIWALASDSGGQEVQYHMDYAELIRYESNVMAVPLWAGTLQCTSSKIERGEFAVNVKGLDHYATHGYKGNLCKDSTMGGWTSSCRQQQQPPSSTHANGVHYNSETGWVTVPYKYNRMIRHSGHLPHLSAPFSCANKRVIVGFNVFRKDVGPLVQEAPEHSHAFRRRIKYQRVLLMSNNNNDDDNITLSNIQQNKALCKLLVLAKRETIKQAWKEAQAVLDQELERCVSANGTVVQTLMDELGTTEDGVWPCSVDVQVHIQRRVKEGKFTCNTKQVTPESLVYKIGPVWGDVLE